MRWRMSEQLNVSTRTLIILACSATAGVLLEFYDFTIFGYAAASAFPQVFFPNLAPSQALVFSYLTYGAGYPARLLGAFIFGHFGDRTGRKFAFLINIVIVGASTCLTGLFRWTGPPQLHRLCRLFDTGADSSGRDQPQSCL